MSKVIVLGGGVAGLSAAHNLIKRGFDVEVYERNPMYYGGKARSIDYDHDRTYTHPLPAEHGFRFFPGFYQHVTATMQEIPFRQGKKKQSVFDNLVATSRIMVARYDKAPISTTASFPRSLADFKLLIHDITGVDSGLTREEVEFFAGRVWQLVSSCQERRQNEYERLSWWQFTEAARFSKTYQHLLVEGLTRTLVAAKAELASTKTGGDIFLQLIYCMTDPSVNTDRVLNGPTNDQWLLPWVSYLREKHVSLQQGISAVRLNLDPSARQIASVTLQDWNGKQWEVRGDYYILAMPVEQAATLIRDDLVQADQTLGYIRQLAPSVAWMNGIQFYLNKDVTLNQGHIICCDSEWAITCISQAQFWDHYHLQHRGNGDVRGVLSVDISDWTTPGRFTTRKAAQDCLRDEVAEEVWAQLKHSLNTDQVRLTDDMRVDYYLDRDIRYKTSAQIQQEQQDLKNLEPLLVNQVNTWSLRPESHCGIPNLFFASDYVRTNTDLATMEGANEAARRAVNDVLQASGSRERPCEVWPLHEPFCFALLKWYDSRRYAKGMPWSGTFPLWIRALTVLLGILYLVRGLSIALLRRARLDKEAIFVIGTMVMTLGFTYLAARFNWGPVSAFVLAFGMFAWLSSYALAEQDYFLGRLLVFGLTAGIVELAADHWLVDGIHGLVYPHAEFRLWSSPLYMPFAWAVVLIQVGYFGFLFSRRHGLWASYLFTFLLGMCFIPLFEWLARYASWWHYHKSLPGVARTPYFIILGEGLICMVLPAIYNKAWKRTHLDPVINGALFGIWIFLSYFIAYQLLG
ncbi:MAG TPA: FAD-dependent oxidoreductase [Chitinophagaceae bacterium]|nr:FAD-dependent oxidoreductase [Chitinophagaceae bacterium]